ncbi:hypothetical protein SB847_22040, partial [Bacillus sp. SIMBA_026]|uniref:hypothetical protein n=1 Tax=Bacillus sp. SIMBA_026 TaxID=3085769 RepID=UPI00397D861F
EQLPPNWLAAMNRELQDTDIGKHATLFVGVIDHDLLAFVSASLVREQDYFLDYYVADNTWKFVVALIVLPSLVWVILHR